MPPSTHQGVADDGVNVVSGSPGNSPSGADAVRSHASKLGRELVRLSRVRSSDYLVDRWRVLADRFRPLLRTLHSSRRQTLVEEDIKSLYDNAGLLSTELQGTGDALRSYRRLPQV